MDAAGNWSRRCLPPVALALLIWAAGCGGGMPGVSGGPLAVRLVTAAESAWQAGDLDARVTPGANGWELEIDAVSTSPAQTLLLEVQLPQEYRAEDVRLLAPPAQLSLCVSDRPGVLAYGVVLPPGQKLAPGPLLSARLTRAGSIRRASKTPAGNAGYVPDLAGTDNGLGGWVLGWGYYNTGDYNQDRQVQISDLAPLGIHFNEQAPAFPAAFPADSIGAVIDASGDARITIADLAPIGVNYGNIIDAYKVYRAETPDPEQAAVVEVAQAAFADSSVATDSRRRFNYTLSSTVLVDGAYYFLRPCDTAGSGTGTASNIVQYQRSGTLKFYNPGAGNFTVDSGQAQNPQLVLMPAILGVSEPGAPVVVYTTLGGGGASPLKIAYYDGAAWVSEDIGGGGNYTLGAAAWLAGGGGDPGAGIVVAGSINDGMVVERRYDSGWAYSGGQDVGTTAGAGVFSGLSFDRNPASGAFGVAHAYTGAGAGSVAYSYSNGTGAWETLQVYDGEAVADVAFRFDPGGQAPWLAFTHGTTTATQGLISLDYHLEQGRLNGSTWNLTAVAYPDSPQQLDLGFRSDGTPQLALTAARDYEISVPGYGSWTISMLYDVAVGSYSGSAWSFVLAFESTFGVSIEPGWPPTTLVLSLNFAPDVRWAKADELLHPAAQGEIKLDIQTMTPQDGGLSMDARYLTRQGSGSYSESSYFTGDPGSSHSWEQNSGGQPVCAYIRSTSITAQQVLSGEFAVAGELMFWQP